MAKKTVPQSEILLHLHKALEACSLCLGHLAVVKNAVPGYGISTKNHKKVEKTYKALSRQNKELANVSRNWMR